MSLTTETVLELVDGLSLTHDKGRFKLAVGQRQFYPGRYVLPILQAFSTPKSLRQGIKDLQGHAKGTSGWVELVAQVKQLHEFGLLVEPGGKRQRRAHEKRFDSAPSHIRMLNDERRTSCFQLAIRRTVEPGDVVLDIGTGTGVLAVTAALAGARHVYAIEATAMSRVARRLVEANGVSDRVTVIEAHSFDVELPERAHVLVSEIIGDDPLGERILPTFADAKQRLLADGPRAIPRRLQVRGLVLEVPEERMQQFRFTRTAVQSWEQKYGLDFSALVLTSEMQDHVAHVNSYETRHWKRLSDPILLAEFDLLDCEPTPIERKVHLRVTTEGQASGLLVFFQVDLGSGVNLSLHPDDATPRNSWGNLLYLFSRPKAITLGEELHVLYSYGDHGSAITLAR